MAIHSSILAWRISWTEEPGELQSLGSQRVRHDWNDLAQTHKASLAARPTWSRVPGHQGIDRTINSLQLGSGFLWEGFVAGLGGLLKLGARPLQATLHLSSQEHFWERWTRITGEISDLTITSWEVGLLKGGLLSPFLPRASLGCGQEKGSLSGECQITEQCRIDFLKTEKARCLYFFVSSSEGLKRFRNRSPLASLSEGSSVLFIQQLSAECLLCAQPCSGHEQLTVNSAETPAFVELSANGRERP